MRTWPTASTGSSRIEEPLFTQAGQDIKAPAIVHPKVAVGVKEPGPAIAITR